MLDVSDYQGSNDKPGMYFQYWFNRTVDGQTFEVCFYAFQETDARKQYEELYKTEAGTLLRRENW